MANIGIDAVTLTNGLVTYHTINTGQQSTYIEAVFTNHDSVKRRVELHMIPNGDSATESNKIIAHQDGENELNPGEQRRYPYFQFLASGDFIQAKSIASGLSPPAGEVTFKLSVKEEAV